MNDTSSRSHPSVRAMVLTACASLGLIAGIALVWLGGRSVAGEFALRNSSSIVDARVTASRITDSRRTGRSYELTYRFQTPGRATPYDHGDETGRRNLWASVEDEATWRAARSSGIVSVRYLPSDPAVNRPVKAGAAPLGDPIAGLVLGLMIGLPSALVIALQARALRRGPPAA